MLGPFCYLRCIRLLPRHGEPQSFLWVHHVVSVLGGRRDCELDAADSAVELVAARAVVRRDWCTRVHAHVTAVVRGEDHRRPWQQPDLHRPSSRPRTARQRHPCRGLHRRRQTPCAPGGDRLGCAPRDSAKKCLTPERGCSSTSACLPSRTGSSRRCCRPGRLITPSAPDVWHVDLCGHRVRLVL